MPPEPLPKRTSVDQLIDMVEARDPQGKQVTCLLKTRIMAMLLACPDLFKVDREALGRVLNLPPDWD